MRLIQVYLIGRSQVSAVIATISKLATLIWPVHNSARRLCLTEQEIRSVGARTLNSVSFCERKESRVVASYHDLSKHGKFVLHLCYCGLYGV